MSIEEIKAAIAIFEKYVEQHRLPMFHAEHDVLSGPNEDQLPGITNEDEEKLIGMGWSVDQYDCWAHNCSC